MAKIKITNGFPNTDGEGVVITGVLLDGSINVGDSLVINEEMVSLMHIQFDAVTFPGVIHVFMRVTPDSGIIWHKTYGHNYEIINL